MEPSGKCHLRSNVSRLGHRLLVLRDSVDDLHRNGDRRTNNSANCAKELANADTAIDAAKNVSASLPSKFTYAYAFVGKLKFQFPSMF
jgi:hypothetical protein